MLFLRTNEPWPLQGGRFWAEKEDAGRPSTTQEGLVQAMPQTTHARRTARDVASLHPPLCTTARFRVETALTPPPAPALCLCVDPRMLSALRHADNACLCLGTSVPAPRPSCFPCKRPHKDKSPHQASLDQQWMVDQMSGPLLIALHASAQPSGVAVLLAVSSALSDRDAQLSHVGE